MGKFVSIVQQQGDVYENHNNHPNSNQLLFPRVIQHLGVNKETISNKSKTKSFIFD